ncbi:protein ALP1-like isoform X2 [Acropora millepora]|nr:protein ALP1-like isoform X2 [Acropora millepora]
MLFTDIYVGWPGSVHDARVLRNSPLYQTAEHHFQGDSHLLGDSAYPLHRWLLTPFRDNGHLSRQEVNYNNKHAKTRQTIERAFGLLKGRWRRLKFIEMENINECPAIVAAACVLHNFCLLVLLMERTLMTFWMSLMVMMVMTSVNYQFMFQDHKLLQREIKWLFFSTTSTCN